MEVKFEKLSNVLGELTVNLEEKDYAEKVKKELNRIRKERQVPGYRPGHAPEGLIKKKFGEAVRYDIVNKEIGDAIFDYIRKNNLEVLGQPVADPSNRFEENEKDFNFKFKVGLAPEIDTHVNKDLKVPYYEIEVTDAMVDDEITALRQRLGRQVSGEETEPNAVIKGVISELNPDGTIKPDGILVENGILAPIHFTDEEQKKLFEGKKKGETVVFNPSIAAGNNEVELSSMLNIDKSDVANHTGDFNFEITDIIVLRPAELDQEFFDQAFGKDTIHNEEELKDNVRKVIANSLINDSNYRFSIDAKNVITKAVGPINLPDEILKDFLKKQNEAMTEENIDEEYEKMVPDITWDLIKGKISRQLEVTVNDEDLKNEARGVVIRQLSQYGNVTEQMVEHYADQLMQDNKNRSYLYTNAETRKVYDAIQKAVTLDKKSVTVDEFKNLFDKAQ